jgi:hypothetical protein
MKRVRDELSFAREIEHELHTVLMKLDTSRFALTASRLSFAIDAIGQELHTLQQRDFVMLMETDQLGIA